MSTFLATQDMRVQRHFEVFEIDLPVITGACTVSGAGGFGTPLTCDQAWTNEPKKKIDGDHPFTADFYGVVLAAVPSAPVKFTTSSKLPT